MSSTPSSWFSHFCMSQNDAVSRKFARLTNGAIVPESPATPARALSNLFTSSIWRTPMACTSLIWRLIEVVLQAGLSSFMVHPNTTLVSMPITTAIFPALMTSRASNGSVTTRYQPRPGPPYCASM